MWHAFHLVARTVEALVGLFCIVTAIMLYPNEEGKLQSTFEDFWIRVDDYQRLALSKHAAFMTQVANFETRLLDRVFGTRLFSWRAIGVSLASSILAVAGIFFYVSVFEMLGPYTPPLFFSAFTFLFAMLVLVPSVCVRSKRIVGTIVVCVFLLLAAIPLELLSETYRDIMDSSSGVIDFELIFPMIPVIGFICDVLFIATTRRLLRWAQESTSSVEVVLIVLFNLVLAVALMAPLVFWHSLVKLPAIAIVDAALVAVSNVFDVILALMFVVLALTLLTHRALWPLLNRTLFRLQDVGTKGRRAILVTVGFALMGAGLTGKVPELVKEIVEKLG